MEDGTVLCRPKTLPTSYQTAKQDLILACAANEHEVKDVVKYEYTTGTLKSEDFRRTEAMRRWTLVSKDEDQQPF